MAGKATLDLQDRALLCVGRAVYSTGCDGWKRVVNRRRKIRQFGAVARIGVGDETNRFHALEGS